MPLDEEKGEEEIKNQLKEENCYSVPNCIHR